MSNLSNLSETALLSKSYQELSKEVGKNFIGKNKAALVKMIIDARTPKASTKPTPKKAEKPATDKVATKKAKKAVTESQTETAAA